MYTGYGNPHRKEESMMATVESNARWKRENTINVSVRLMNKTEMDVIEALNQREGSMRSRLLQLLRLGIEYEKKMTVGELKNLLNGFDNSAEVCVAECPSWGSKYAETITNAIDLQLTRFYGPDGRVVCLTLGGQIGAVSA